jgi:HAD superfamily hydrolase (TIGR01509 family)
MKQCVIFDMDGVIIDSEPIHMACEKEVFKMLGVPVSNEEHHSMTGTTDKAMWSRIAGKHELSVTITEAIQLTKTRYMDHLKNKFHLVPVPYVPELIAELYKNDFSLILASSSPHEQIDYILENLGLKPYFNASISGEDMKAGKPDPEIFLKAAQAAGADPKNCVVIEDSNNGVTAAKKAGMKCIGFLNPNSGQQDLSQANRIVHTFRDISPGMIRSLLKPD